MLTVVERIDFVWNTHSFNLEEHFGAVSKRREIKRIAGCNAHPGGLIIKLNIGLDAKIKVVA